MAGPRTPNRNRAQLFLDAFRGAGFDRPTIGSFARACNISKSLLDKVITDQREATYELVTSVSEGTGLSRQISRAVFTWLRSQPTEKKP